MLRALHLGSDPWCNARGDALASRPRRAAPNGGDGNSDVPPNPPPGVDFPLGFFDFQLGGLTLGETVDIRFFIPGGAPTPFDWWMFGPEPADGSDHFWVFAAGFTDVEFTLTITDGERGDLDLTADGVITDPGAPDALTRGRPPDITAGVRPQL